MKPVSLGGIMVGEGCEPFILAELSGNHNQSLDRAMAIVEAAAAAGADGVKLQTYTAETMTLNLAEGPFVVNDPSTPWHGRTLYDLYQEAHTPWAWHEPIFNRCKELGMVAFSAPFDATAVDFLTTLQVPAFKIASFENTDHPLIRKVAATGKPMIISSGMAALHELDESRQVAREAGCQELIMLKCTSTYTPDPANSHLRTIAHMQELFECPVGLSDHTLGIGAAVAGVALGAALVEKHLTLSRADGGVDSAFSLEPHEFKQLVEECKRAWRAVGRVQYGSVVSERPSRSFRRSLYITQDMKAGERLDEETMRAIRPGEGLPPKYYEMLLGKRVNRDVKRGTPLSFDLLG